MKSHTKEAVEMTALATGTDRPVARLMAEIDWYLRAVDVFRAEGCAPSWGDEPAGNASESWEEN
jgi:hypothetical protein